MVKPRFSNAALLLLGTLLPAASAQNLVQAPQPPRVGSPAINADTPGSQSDAFFGRAESNQIPEGKIREVWAAQRQLLEDERKLTVHEKPNLRQAIILTRLGRAASVLDPPTKPNTAEQYYADADKMLRDIEAGSTPAGFKEALADLLRYRADNLTLLGREIEAAEYLSDALAAARQSSYRDGVDEAKIRTAAAAIAVKQGNWTKAMHSLQPALLILYGKAKESPNFNPQLQQEALWLNALAVAGAGEDAVPEFNKFLLEFPNIKPEKKAQALWRVAMNIKARAPMEPVLTRTDDEAKTLRQKHIEELAKEQIVLRTAKQYLEQVSDKQSVSVSSLSLAVYMELTACYEAMGDFGIEAEAAYQEALRLTAELYGKDSPLLIPILERYATALEGSKRSTEGQKQRELASMLAQISLKKIAKLPSSPSK